ncbi:MAG: MazG nucleotide pyrophosphohydrolase domain-containing protein [Actinomycetes bacterium]
MWLTTSDGPAESSLLELVEVMARLRRECAWKAGQTHRSLARYLLEETYETLEAIEAGDDAHLREELGDLLLQVLFHAVIAEEQGRFDIDDVAADLVVKLRRRNPHVFDPGAATVTDAVAIDEQWERIKAEEKQRSGLREGVPE